MELKAFDMVTDYRNKAIAVLRLQKVNGLAQKLQQANSSISKATKTNDELTAQREHVTSGAYSPSYDDMNRFDSPSAAQAAVVEKIDKQLEANNKALEAANKSKAEVEDEIRAWAKGGEGHRFSREVITALADELIKQDGNNLKLEEVQVSGDAASQEEFVPQDLQS